MTNPDHLNYGTDRSQALKILMDAGYNPIAITIMICEETFIFETEEEAIEAHKVFEMDPNPSIIQGFWYGEEKFHEAWKDYINEGYKDNESEAPKVYWLNK